MTADTVLTGARVWTAVEGGPPCSAVAVRDGRILAVGSDAQVQPVIGSNTDVVELGGRTVLPGFIDAHVHFITGGFQLGRVDLRDASTPEEFARRIGRFAETLEPGAWILGGGWDDQAWGGGLPDRSWIDPVTPNHPVFVSRLDLHMALANTLALDRAGIATEEADPPGGTLVRGDGGRLTGVVKDEAMRLVERAVPQPTETALDGALAVASKHALTRGVTQVHDMGTWSHLETYARARAAGHLRTRIYSVLPLATLDRLGEWIDEQRGRGDARLWWGGVKAFVDGSLGSSTAWFHEPYSDDPANSGLVVTDLPELRANILRAASEGLQPVVHAIGDRANDWLLDAFEALEAPVRAACRPRIEHAQHLTEAAIGRFGRLGVIASVQPYHVADDGRWAEDRIGEERARRTYAFQSLLDEGAELACGSDWTVAPLDPLLGIQAALTRATIDGASPEGWHPAQRISLESALRGYTIAAARAGFSDLYTGSLEVGKAADLVVLAGDIFETPPDRISDLGVELTMVDGTAEYRRR